MSWRYCSMGYTKSFDSKRFGLDCKFSVAKLINSQTGPASRSVLPCEVLSLCIAWTVLDLHRTSTTLERLLRGFSTKASCCLALACPHNWQTSLTAADDKQELLLILQGTRDDLCYRNLPRVPSSTTAAAQGRNRHLTTSCRW